MSYICNFDEWWNRHFPGKEKFGYIYKYVKYTWHDREAEIARLNDLLVTMSKSLTVERDFTAFPP